MRNIALSVNVARCVLAAAPSAEYTCKFNVMSLSSTVSHDNDNDNDKDYRE